MCLVVLWTTDVYSVLRLLFRSDFFFNDTATTEIYTYGHTLSLHDALPIFGDAAAAAGERRQFEVVGREQGVTAVDAGQVARARIGEREAVVGRGDRKSTRLNSSH